MPSRVEFTEFVRLRDAGAQIVEVLPEEDYDWAHIPEAINLPLKELDGTTASQLDRSRDVVVYCHDYLWDLSPRAACRLETLGFEHVHDYVPGKADWMARARPVHGDQATAATAAGCARTDVVTCRLDDPIADVRKRVADSPYGFGLVVHQENVVLGRLRMSAMKDAPDDARAEQVMSPGPSTERGDTDARELAEKLDKKDLKTAIVTDPEGRLIGVVLRQDL